MSIEAVTRSGYLWLIVKDAGSYCAVLLALCILVAALSAAMEARLSVLTSVLYANSMTLILGAALFCTQSVIKGVATSVPVSLIGLLLFAPTYAVSLLIGITWLATSRWKNPGRRLFDLAQISATSIDLMIRTSESFCSMCGDDIDWSTAT